MAHYAFLDSNNIVTEVIVGKDEGEEGIDWEQRYSDIRGQRCKRTSYNTKNGLYRDSITNEPIEDQSKAFRKNFAGIGYFYDNIRDAFIPPRTFPSWTLNENTCNWEPPTPIPDDVGSGDPPKQYAWDEITQDWYDVTPTE